MTASVKLHNRSFLAGLGAVRGTMLLDMVLSGSYLFAVLVCPVWFLVAVVGGIVRGSSLRLTAARMLIPLVTLLLVIVNTSLQGRIARANAARVIEACEQYQKVNGSLPDQLDDLVPRYINSIPRAKYCLEFGEFMCFGPQTPILVWCEIPPFDRRVYNFERGSWGYVD